METRPGNFQFPTSGKVLGVFLFSFFFYELYRGNVWEALYDGATTAAQFQVSLLNGRPVR